MQKRGRQKFEPLNIPIGPIVEHYGGDLSRLRGGQWRKLSCILHEDKSPSATINFSLNRYHCFSCGVSEDAVGLVMHIEHATFKDALARAEAITGTSSEGVRGKRRDGAALFAGPWDW